MFVFTKLQQEAEALNGLEMQNSLRKVEFLKETVPF